MKMSEQIAVLDGLGLVPVSSIGPAQDGRIGQVKAQVDQYGRLIMPGVLARTNVIDASSGANYSGGSAYAPGLPLMPSSAGLADADLLNFVNQSGVLPPKMNVIDASGGANYSGGASYAVGLPLLPSSAGLAALEGRLGRKIKRGLKKGIKKFAKANLKIATGEMLGDYGYGRAGLGDGYGRAGLGGCSCPSLDGFESSTLGIVPVSPIGSSQDGRIGQVKAQVDQYGRLIMPGVLARTNVIDASAGANYSGGSSYAVGLPLMPSSSGLADLEGKIGRRIKRKLKKLGKGLKKAVSVVAKIGGKLVPIPGANMAGKLIGGALSDYQYAALAGLAELSVVDGLDAVPSVEFKRQLTADARPLFDQTASSAVVAKLKQAANAANRAKNKDEAARIGRQLSIAREVRRKLVALPPRAQVNLEQLDAIIRGVAGGVVGGSPVNQAKAAQLNVLIKNIGAAAARSPV